MNGMVLWGKSVLAVVRTSVKGHSKLSTRGKPCTRGM